MNLEDWQNLQQRLDTAHQNALGMQFGTRDLWTMQRAVYEKLREANNE